MLLEARTLPGEKPTEQEITSTLEIEVHANQWFLYNKPRNNETLEFVDSTKTDLLCEWQDIVVAFRERYSRWEESSLLEHHRERLSRRRKMELHLDLR